MGFLDQLFKKKDTNTTSHTNTAAPTSSASTSANSDEKDCCFDESVVCARIEKIAAEEWGEYELRKNIAAAELGASEDARDYSYGLYLNGVPKAMIIIIDVPSHYKKKDVRLAHEACKNQNVFCMNLLLHLPNRRSYISSQLRDHVAR